MGTNFYVIAPPTCGGSCGTHCKTEEIHLGKSSVGWAFTFRAYPEPDSAPEAVTWPVNDFGSWLRLLELGELRDEYGQPKDMADLLDLIEKKRAPEFRHNEEGYGMYRDADGNDFCTPEFC